MQFEGKDKTAVDYVPFLCILLCISQKIRRRTGGFVLSCTGIMEKTYFYSRKTISLFWGPRTPQYRPLRFSLLKKHGRCLLFLSRIRHILPALSFSVPGNESIIFGKKAGNLVVSPILPLFGWLSGNDRALKKSARRRSLIVKPGIAMLN